MKLQLTTPLLATLLASFASPASADVLSGGAPDPGNANLKLWLDAGTAVFSDAGSTAATNGVPVQQWNNQVAAAAAASNATQTTLANKPSFVASSINSLPAIRFDGLGATADGDWLRGNFSLSAAKTMFVVMRDTGTPTNCCSGAFSPNGGYNSLGTKSSGGGIRLNIDWGGSGNTAATDILNQPVVAVLTWDTTAPPYATMYLNGAQDAIENQSKAADSTSYLVGTRQTTFAGRFFRGDIAEILAYDTVLSEADQNDIGGYLANKYAIATSYVYVPPGAFTITEIDYKPATNEVTLTWTSRPNVTYAAKYSFDMTDWEPDLDDNLTPDKDENSEDGHHFTETFKLEFGLEDIGDLFFRIEEK